MDLGTVRKRLEKAEYKTLRELIYDLNLIWNNCRTFNLKNSKIVKFANYLEKKMTSMINKNFKNINSSNCDSPKKYKKNKKSKSLTYTEMKQLYEIIPSQDDETLTQIVKLTLNICPDAIMDKNEEKLQIKINLLNRKAYDNIIKCLPKEKSEEMTKNE